MTKRGAGASYVSTGAGGIDYEVNLAASCLVRLLTQTSDRLMPQGAVPIRVSLQDRSGPAGFDDIAVTVLDDDGEELVVYVQAKRSFSFSATGGFADLVQGIFSKTQTSDAPWHAVLVTGEASLAFDDIQDVLGSARSSTSARQFFSRWAQPGTSNKVKRSFIDAIKSALASDEAAAWNVMRRLRVLHYDFNLIEGADRDTATDLLVGHGGYTPSEAAAFFEQLRSLALVNGRLAGEWNRMTLVASLNLTFRSARPAPNLSILQNDSSLALAAIPVHMQTADHYPAVALLRQAAFTEAQVHLNHERIVRITGEAGSGKSGLLKRLACRFQGRVLVLKDDRFTQTTWSAYAHTLGVTLSAQQTVDELAVSGPCLLAIDGADRVLLSQQKGVVLDLLRAIAASPLVDRWSVVTSARDFQTRDLVAVALVEAGLPIGVSVTVEPLETEDVNLLGEVFPAILTLAGRGDLGDRNRILFMLREVLASAQLVSPSTEVALFSAWATRGSTAINSLPERDKALAEMGELLLCRPQRPPGLVDIETVGRTQLIDEGVIYSDPSRDVLGFSHDIYEDWILARTFDRHLADLPRLLAEADQPLWWLRAMRLLGQLLLESGVRGGEWKDLLTRLSADKDLDPAWSRSLLVAALYSERSGEILDGLEDMLLKDDANLLQRLIETLLVHEVRLDDRYLHSPHLADESEVNRLRIAAAFKIPLWNSWIAFLRWSLRRWRNWPVILIPRLAEVAEIWCNVMEGHKNQITKAILSTALPWLIEVEEARYPKDRDDRRDPFGLENLSYDDEKDLEKRLRRILTLGVTAAPDTVETYLLRLTSLARMREARSQIIEAPRQIPSVLPKVYVDLTLVQFTPKRKRDRAVEDELPFRRDIFPGFGFNESGISGSQGFFPASPDRGGFSQLFESDETQALRLFRRLEIRAAVYYRNYTKRREGRQPRPVKLHTSWGVIPLWGDENVYRWCRGMLGSHVLGSIYLAMDEWLARQASAGRPLNELFALVLKPNGLVSTACPCICVLADHVNSPGQIDAAGPFLEAPRLWRYDLRRFNDDHPLVGPMGFWPYDRHYEAALRVFARYKKRQFLRNDLLLPFQINAGEPVRSRFHERSRAWTEVDLAAFDDELQDAVLAAQRRDEIGLYRSDADPQQICIEENDDGQSLTVRIERPPGDGPSMEALQRDLTLLNDACRLSLWVTRSREAGALQPDFTLAEAMTAAKTLMSVETSGRSDVDMFARHRASAVIGTASLIARYADDTMLDVCHDWVREIILAGCSLRSYHPDDSGALHPYQLLFDDPQVFGVEGLGVLISRGRGMNGDCELALDLAAHPLNEVAAAIVRHLDGEALGEFAWTATVLALDLCNVRQNQHWRKGGDSGYQRDRLRVWRNAVRKARAHPNSIPNPPAPPWEKRWVLQARLRWPLKSVPMWSRWAFDGQRATLIFKSIPFQRFAQDAQRAKRLGAYLKSLVIWAERYFLDENRSGFGRDYPHETMDAVATAAGRLAATGTGISLWEAFQTLDKRHYRHDLLGYYLEALVTELVNSGRPPDDLFWAAWMPPVDFVLSRLPRPSADGPRTYSLDKSVAAAGFVGPYMSPLPAEWPHLEQLLPHLDRWVDATLFSATAANDLLRFAERFTNAQRQKWVIPWLNRYVDTYQGNPAFWGRHSMGDLSAALLKPLQFSDEPIRRDIRRILGVVADAGSLAARDVLTLFAGSRSR